MIEDEDLMDRVRLCVGLGVTSRQLQGMDVATIRREVLEVATDAMRDNFDDEHQVETGVAVARREIDRILVSGGKPIARSVPMGEG